MRIAYVSAGAGGMYCGSCMHDNALAGALIRQGHEVALIPTWTPMRTDDLDVSIDRVFYGAVNVYLEQKTKLFRKTPWLVDRLLNGRWLLSWASSRASSVDAAALGELTLSVLEGEAGHHRKELERLVEWLGEFRPDLVHLTNSMFLGTARRIRSELKVPVLCSLQGEDLFLDNLAEPYRRRVHRALQEKARDADGFVATSRFYADRMAPYLQVPRGKIRIVPLGINVRGHRAPTRTGASDPFVIGYLARVCPEKGLHLLADAYRGLVERVGRGRARLKVAGYVGAGDRKYLEEIRDRVREWGVADSVEFSGEIDRVRKLDFLEAIDVLSVPTVYREPKGLFVLEALASGVPVVQPAHGAFPELLEATGGGMLVEPGSAAALADALERLIRDPGQRREMGRRGCETVRRDFTDDRMAENTLAVYRSYLESEPRAVGV